MSPLLKKMRQQARLHAKLKECDCDELRAELAQVEKDIEGMIAAHNSKFPPSTNTYSDATVEFEDRAGFRYN